jgi:hypothetical protein
MTIRLTQKDAWEEGLDKEDVSKLMELRGYLETRLKEVEEESERLRVLSKIVEEVIVSKSFRVAETLQPIPQKRETSLPTSEPEESIPLKTAQGVPLAAMVVSPPNVRIVPVEDLEFSVHTPPFQSFFISRILEPMQMKDDEAVRNGEFLPENALSYEVVAEGDIIKEVVIRNYGGDTRLREVKSACRWTLEKMYERIHGA